MDSPPSIFIEPPEDDHQEFVSSNDYTSPLFTTDFSQGDEHIFYNQSNVSTDSILSHDSSLFPSFLDTTLGGANFTSYRQPEGPNSPLSDRKYDGTCSVERCCDTFFKPFQMSSAIYSTKSVHLQSR
ncbi:hypothetical protein M378DRAFT_111974, partial [Amanita muscaria Koide BX008]